MGVYESDVFDNYVVVHNGDRRTIGEMKVAAANGCYSCWYWMEVLNYTEKLKKAQSSQEQENK